MNATAQQSGKIYEDSFRKGRLIVKHVKGRVVIDTHYKIGLGDGKWYPDNREWFDSIDEARKGWQKAVRRVS